MLAATLTRSGTGTMPYTSVVHITRKVQTDMLEIGDTYAYFTEKYAQDVIHDVRVFIDEEVDRQGRVRLVESRHESSSRRATLHRR